MMNWRGIRLAAALAAAGVLPALPALAFEPEGTECIAPAAPGGGWDFTCREVGKTMQDLKLVPGTMQVTNINGGGGGVAFAEVVNKRNDNNNLIVAASSATSTRLAQNAFPGNTMDQVRWLGTRRRRLRHHRGGQGLAHQHAPRADGQDQGRSHQHLDRRRLGGRRLGPPEGADRRPRGRLQDVRKIKYVPFDGGGEAVTQLLAGSVQAFTGDASEAKGFVDSGDIKVIAVLAPERLPGDFARFPTAKEQGIDAVGANWRGFYGPGGMSDDAYAFWVDAIGKVYESDEWKGIMANSGIAPLDLRGEDFQKFVAERVAETAALSKEIGLIK